MSSIEIIALVVVLLSVIKIVFLLLSPEAWVRNVGKLWTRPSVTTAVSLILMLVVLKYLLVELTIVEIFATFAFAALFMRLMLAPYAREFYEVTTRNIDPRTYLRKSWLPTLLWLGLSVWVITELI